MQKRTELIKSPKAFLYRTLRAYKFLWIKNIFLEDFYQEIDIFLWEYSQKNSLQYPVPEEGWVLYPQEFSNAGQRHFYRMAVDYGFKKPKYAGRFEQKETPTLEPAWAVTEGEEYDSSKNRLLAVNPWLAHAAAEEMNRRLEICHQAILAVAGKESAVWWQAFRAYLLGGNQADVAFITGWDNQTVDENVYLMVEAIRTRSGIDLEAEIPLPALGNRHFTGKGSGRKPDPKRPRVPVGLPQDLLKLPLEVVMKAYGVSKATASRIAYRGWYCPGYSSRKQKKGRRGRRPKK